MHNINYHTYLEISITVLSIYVLHLLWIRILNLLSYIMFRLPCVFWPLSSLSMVSVLLDRFWPRTTMTLGVVILDSFILKDAIDVFFSLFRYKDSVFKLESTRQIFSFNMVFFVEKMWSYNSVFVEIFERGTLTTDLPVLLARALKLRMSFLSLVACVIKVPTFEDNL